MQAEPAFFPRDGIKLFFHMLCVAIYMCQEHRKQYIYIYIYIYIYVFHYMYIVYMCNACIKPFVRAFTRTVAMFRRSLDGGPAWFALHSTKD